MPGTQVLTQCRLELPLIQQEPGRPGFVLGSQPSALKCPGALPSEREWGLQPAASALLVLIRKGGGRGLRLQGKQDSPEEETVGPPAGFAGGPEGGVEGAFIPSSWRPAQRGELGPRTKPFSRTEATPRCLWTSFPPLVGSLVLGSTDPLRGKTPASQEPAPGPPAGEARPPGAPASGSHTRVGEVGSAL